MAEGEALLRRRASVTGVAKGKAFLVRDAAGNDGRLDEMLGREGGPASRR